ncbi:MAG: circularly permuted type 2 ATP-grasp protein [Betaproteobacteria bacterium]
MPPALLSSYAPAAVGYDELLAAPGAPRAHWRRLYDTLAASSDDAMRERMQWVRRRVRENGVTYNVYDDSEGASRPWELDMLPFILPADEWAGIEAAVAQRATLLNRVLIDIYGEQRTLAEGLLPPALIYGHAGFLRPARGVPAPGGTLLHTYAADLARSPDGRWWVMDDRTQAPSGAGYALENRLVISRLFPELFRDLKVQRLADFFAALRDSIALWAPAGREAPVTVLLTPGPLNETYFEHTYLARYLGLPLVEGSDLTVREGKVWLRTLSGLQRVHAILRRLDDDYCDPLELRSDSALGIPGLVDAARRGNVLVANALGSNLLESGALLGYLPKLCEKLLGEALKMPSVGTWWCGEPPALEDAIARLDQLVIKSAYPQARVDPMFGEDLDERGRARVVNMLRARPGMYVAQELVRLSQAPVCDREDPRRLAARAFGLRVYACATPNGYAVMPGGLTRVATGPDARVISMQRGGSSKDTWVLTTGQVSTLTLLRREVRPQDLVRTGLNLSSRVVENLFWFGRQAERCDDTSRLLRVALVRLIEESAAERERIWPVIAAVLQHAGVLTEEEAAADEVAMARSLRAAIVDDSRPGLAGSLSSLLGVASQLRERLSTDNWHTLNQMQRRLARSKGRPLSLGDALTELDVDIAAFMTLSGFALDGMTRDHGWRFLSMGRRIERLQFLCGALQQALAGPADADLVWLLELADSSITYRSRYMARPEWLPVLDLLVCDGTNPRSIAFQLKGLHDFLGRISDAYGEGVDEELKDALAGLESLDPGADLRHGSVRLAQLLGEWHDASARLSEQIGLRFFSHVGEVNRQTFGV